MAYIVQPPEDEQKQQAPAGGSSPFSVMAPQQKQPVQGSGSFFNMQRLLDANQGAGQRVSQALTGQANNATTNAQQKLGQTVDQFNTAATFNVNGSAAPPSVTSPAVTAQQNMNRLYSNFNPAAPAPTGPQVPGIHYGPAPTPKAAPGIGFSTQAAPQPAAPPYSPAVAQQYENAAYNGPRALSDQAGYQDAVGAMNTAQQYGRALGSFGGRQAMMPEGPGGGPGASAFDALVASANGGPQFAQAQAHAQALSKLFGDAQSNAQTRVGGIDNQVNAFHNAGTQMDQQNIAAKSAQDAATQRASQEQQSMDDLQSTYKQARAHDTFFTGGVPTNPITFDQWTQMTPEARAWAAQNGTARLGNPLGGFGKDPYAHSSAPVTPFSGPTTPKKAFHGS